MSNQVTFQIKIETIGGENVKNVTMDAEELGRVVKEVADEQEKLNTRLLNINQAQQAIQNVISGISQIASEVSKYTAAYSVQETAERKVAQVMHNTMDATEAEIESIKNLCAAQQELGVIDEEVQMAGAQELATYLEKKSSLEKLIPVMNDMLAQQYGLEASQESAATIATMLGKVMEGQTQALSRYGYSFDETQEKILKFGTEEERAAVLAEVVSQSVGGMNQALAQTDSGKAKKLADTIGDLKEQAGACLSRIEPVVSALAEFGMAAQGLISVAQGARGVASALHSVRMSQIAANAASAAGAVHSRVQSVAMGLLTATTGSAAVSMTAFRATVIATYGALSLGLTLAISAAVEVLSHLIAKTDEATDADARAKAEAEAAADARANETRQLSMQKAQLDITIAKLRDFNGTKSEEKRIVEKLNSTYGETMGYFSSVSEWYDALTANSETYCRQMVLEAKIRELANKAAEKELKASELRKQIDNGSLSEKRETQTKLMTTTGTDGRQYTSFYTAVVPHSSPLEKAMEQCLALESEAGNLHREMQAAVQEVNGLTFRVTGSTTRPTVSSGGGTTTTREMKTSGNKTGNWDEFRNGSSRVVEGEKSGSGVHSPESDLRARYEELKQLVNQTTLDYEIGLKGQDEAESIIQSINEELKELGLNPVEIKLKSNDMKKAEERMKDATNSVNEFGQSLSGLGNALELPELDVAGTMAQAIATMISGYATASAEAAAGSPFAWIAFAALGLAQLTAMISSVKGLAKFADGAVAYGPALGLFGEYANAATNPEVVAPLDKLRSIMVSGQPEDAEEIQFRIRGRDLTGVSKKHHRLLRRT